MNHKESFCNVFFFFCSVVFLVYPVSSIDLINSILQGELIKRRQVYVNQI